MSEHLQEVVQVQETPEVIMMLRDIAKRFLGADEEKSPGRIKLNADLNYPEVKKLTITQPHGNPDTFEVKLEEEPDKHGRTGEDFIRDVNRVLLENPADVRIDGNLSGEGIVVLFTKSVTLYFDEDKGVLFM